MFLSNDQIMQDIIELKTKNRSLSQRIFDNLKKTIDVNLYYNKWLKEIGYSVETNHQERRMIFLENKLEKLQRDLIDLQTLQNYNSAELIRLRRIIRDRKNYKHVNGINVLFLDIDGVLNNSNLDDEHLHMEIDDEHIGQFVPDFAHNIDKIVKEFDFKIVVSSTWRKDFTLPVMQSLIRNVFFIDCEVIDYTTKEYLDKDYYTRLEWDPKTSPRDRGLQISKWLAEEKYTINQYVIIDDDSDAAYGHEKNFFKVNGYDGFNDKNLTLFRKFMENLNAGSE